MEKVKTKNIDVYRYAWLADFPDPDNFLAVLFHSGSQYNWFNYKNETVDTLLETGRKETNSLQRAKIYRKAEKIIMEDAPIVPIGFYAQELLVQPYVKGLKLSPLGTPYIQMNKITIETH
jgi:peptide/nickel transport system substrate-binding protein/oligopeptide transport system substrate-binding protein